MEDITMCDNIIKKENRKYSVRFSDGIMAQYWTFEAPADKVLEILSEAFADRSKDCIGDYTEAVLFEGHFSRDEPNIMQHFVAEYMT